MSGAVVFLAVLASVTIITAIFGYKFLDDWSHTGEPETAIRGAILVGISMFLSLFVSEGQESE